jgi:hypothetical protein
MGRDEEAQGMELQIALGADAPHQDGCRDQTWSGLWSQNSAVAGVSGLPAVAWQDSRAVKIESREHSDDKQQTGSKSLKT